MSEHNDCCGECGIIDTIIQAGWMVAKGCELTSEDTRRRRDKSGLCARIRMFASLEVILAKGPRASPLLNDSRKMAGHATGTSYVDAAR